jgi:hypothetical protein
MTDEHDATRGQPVLDPGHAVATVRNGTDVQFELGTAQAGSVSHG